MKKMFIFGLSFLSLASFAASVNDSWGSLKAQHDLNIEWPAARMNHGPMTGEMRVRTKRVPKA